MTDMDEKINNSIQKLKSMDDENSKEYAKELEVLGLNYYENNEEEKAIEALENSLEKHATINEGYKKLMNIYNSKRAEAAKNGNMNEINIWLDKMDKMRNIAKTGTIFR